MKGFKQRESEPGDWMEAMREGDFEAAWQITDRLEAGRRSAGKSAAGIDRSGYLRWNGAKLEGNRVLVSCEHGLGDTLQFARYFPLLGALCPQLIVKVQPALLDLLEGMPGIDCLLDAWSSLADPVHDVAIECMELAYAFRTTLQTIPAEVPYLPLGRLTGRANRPGAPCRKVGLLWAASSWDPGRSLTLGHLSGLGRIEGIKFYSFQQGPEAEECARSPFPVRPLFRWTREIHAAAKAMLQMDLIITVDGMPAHLAGALGVPTWLLLPYQADWRWLARGCRSRWYPTMRLFRQRHPGNWLAPVDEISEALSRAAAAPAADFGSRVAEVITREC